MPFEVTHGPELGLLAELALRGAIANQYRPPQVQIDNSGLAQLNQQEAPSPAPQRAGLSAYQLAHQSGYGPARDALSVATADGTGPFGEETAPVASRVQMGDLQPYAAAAGVVAGGGGRIGAARAFSTVEGERQKQMSRMASYQWQQVAKLFADPNANLSTQQRAEILNQLKQTYAGQNLPNPIDIQTAQDEQTPEVQTANARNKLRGESWYNPIYEEMIDPETNTIDWQRVNDARKIDLEERGSKLKLIETEQKLRRDAYDAEVQGLEVLKPLPLPKEATPEDRAAYRQQQLEYLQAVRGAHSRVFGSAPQAAPATSAPATTRQQEAAAAGVPVINSSDEFDQLVKQGKVQPGFVFVDNEGNTLVVKQDGSVGFAN